MRELLLDYIACPACGGDLTGTYDSWNGDEAMSGHVECRSCANRYPIVRGIPRMNVEMRELENVARTFGYEWSEFHEGEFEKSTVFGRSPEEDWAYFLEGLGITEEELRGKSVLDGGCGSGRLTQQIAEHGAGVVIGVDMNEAIDHVFRHTRHLPNLLLVQGNIMKLPFKSGVFDLAWSNGVIHHTPDAAACAEQLARVVKPRGKLYIWVYAKRFSPFMLAKDAADTLRITRLSERNLLRLCRALSYPTLALIALYRAATRLPLVPRTPWIEWTTRRRTIQELRLTWFDTLSPQYDTAHSEEEVKGWFERSGFEQISAIQEPKVGIRGVRAAA